MVLRRSIFFCILSAAMCQSAVAQGLEVTRSPASPTAAYLESGTAFDAPLAAFRFEASGGSVSVDELTLTLAGSGDFTSDVAEMGAWLDDGDGAFDDTLDQLLWSGPAGASSVTANFTSPVSVSTSTTEDIWIVASYELHAGSSEGKSYEVSIADAADVSTTPSSSAVLGAPTPRSIPLTLIDYFVSGSLLKCSERIYEFRGSGFTPPVQVYLDGQPVGGTVAVNSDHTELLWFFQGVTAPETDDLQLHTASLGLKDTGRGWSEDDCDFPPTNGDYDSHCSTGEATSLLPAALVAALALLLCGRAPGRRSSAGRRLQ